MMEDPDRKQYYFLQEQLEFWRLRYEDEDLPPHERRKAEDKCLDLMDKSIKALQRFNERWENILGELPPMDDNDLRFICSKFRERGMEVTPDELREIMEEDDM